MFSKTWIASYFAMTKTRKYQSMKNPHIRQNPKCHGGYTDEGEALATMERCENGFCTIR
jgi:hypothetical protein